MTKAPWTAPPPSEKLRQMCTHWEKMDPTHHLSGGRWMPEARPGFRTTVDGAPQRDAVTEVHTRYTDAREPISRLSQVQPFGWGVLRCWK